MRSLHQLRMITGAVLALVLCGAGSLRAQEADAFTRANEEFAAGRYQEAIQLYDSLVQSGRAHAAVFYNLGNTWHRAGDDGHAILNYERALALEPSHPEALANLRLVRDKSRALELRRNWMERAVARGTATQFTILAAAGFWIAAFALAALLMSRRRTGVVATTLVLSLLVAAVAGAALYVRENGSDGRALAVVTTEKTEARLATADSAGTVLALPPGSEIKVLSTRGDWLYAQLPNDQRGWIPAANAERVRL
ncbi:MAG: tetratricopeptide repeat protein [Chthoniobacterales bacterium]|nr:tetratricopeptide repeat protein [Chthoniobacterales bacterium]